MRLISRRKIQAIKPQLWWHFFILTLLVLGIFFRFVNIDKKVYWHDEVYTSMRISGFTGDEVGKEIFTGKVIGVKELQKYQQPSPDKGLDDTIKALAGHPEHPPLYYLMARFWVQLFGSSVAVIRSLSAIISLLAFPCLYWLCWELFNSGAFHYRSNTLLPKLNSKIANFSPPASSASPAPSASPLVGWMAIALLSISPFHILYAQEARQYSLWTVTILLSNAALMRAIRLKNSSSWMVYATTLILGLYTSLFSVLGAIGQGIYVVIVENFRWTKTIKAYLLASLIAIIAFIPWILLTIYNWESLERNTTWTNMPMPRWILIVIWLLNLSNIFVDLIFPFNHPFTYIVPPIFFILIGYAIYFLCRHTPKQVWLLIITVMMATIVPLILPDLIFGGQRSASTRYFIPCFIGIQVAVAYLFAHQLTCASFWRRQIWQGIIAVVISCGVVCCAISSQADTWWNKIVSYDNPQSARVINQASQPLVISNPSDTNTGQLISLSYLLDEKVKFQLVGQPEIYIPQIAAGFSDIFLFYPSEILRKGLEEKYGDKIEPIENVPLLKLTIP